MRIVFSGASQLTIMASQALIEKGHEVIIIEVDKDKIDQLSEELDCSFLHGDSATPAILSHVNPKNCDILFCLTESEQVSIITSLLGRSLGFKRVVTRIEDPDLEPLCRELGLEDIIIPTRTMSRHLENMVRGLDNIELSTVLRENVRFFTFIAHKDEATTVSELDLPEDSRVVFFYRDNKCYFVDNETKFREGDEVVILTRSEHLVDLNQRWNPQQVNNEE